MAYSVVQYFTQGVPSFPQAAFSLVQVVTSPQLPLLKKSLEGKHHTTAWLVAGWLLGDCCLQ